MTRGRLYVGTAHWAIPKPLRAEFPVEGSTLERYAARFDAVEINSTFYRLPRLATVERWRDSVPASFRFSVKTPRTITHDAALAGARRELREFLELCRGFGDKLGPVLVQLPGSLELAPRRLDAFLGALRTVHDGPVVLEPRHASFSGDRASALLDKHGVARVLADPARCPGAGEPGGDTGIVYHRLHGSPRVYYDLYDPAFLEALAVEMRDCAARARQVWCIFDNTALGGAAHDALALCRQLFGRLSCSGRPGLAARRSSRRRSTAGPRSADSSSRTTCSARRR